MSALPKLSEAERTDVQRVVQQRRLLTKLIATLQDEKRKLPNNKTLAKLKRVSYSVVRRTVHGDPYRTDHPDDARAA